MDYENESKMNTKKKETTQFKISTTIPKRSIWESYGKVQDDTNNQQNDRNGRPSMPERKIKNHQSIIKRGSRFTEVHAVQIVTDDSGLAHWGVCFSVQSNKPCIRRDNLNIIFVHLTEFIWRYSSVEFNRVFDLVCCKLIMFISV